jgi:hypothetical protein
MRGRYADEVVVACRVQDEAARFSQVRPQRRGTCGVAVAPDKTHVLRLSRVHPRMKRRLTLLGCARSGFPDRHGARRVKHRTARKQLQDACRRSKAWSKANRHRKGKPCSQERTRRLHGHDHDDGLRGHRASLSRFSTWAKPCAFTWLNRRGGKRQSCPWKAFERALDR